MKSKDFEQGLGSDSQEKGFKQSSRVEAGIFSRQVSLPRRIRQLVSFMGAVVLPILSSNSPVYSEINTESTPTPTRGIEYTLPENFQTSAKALNAACEGYTKIAGNKQRVPGSKSTRYFCYRLCERCYR